MEPLKRAPSPFCSGERAHEIGFRLVRELAADGYDVAVACRVLKALAVGPPSLLRITGRRGISHRNRRRHKPGEAVHWKLVQRRFVAAGPDLLLCTDITEHSTRGGKVYCAAVLDVFARQVMGWPIADFRLWRRTGLAWSREDGPRCG